MAVSKLVRVQGANKVPLPHGTQASPAPCQCGVMVSELILSARLSVMLIDISSGVRGKTV